MASASFSQITSIWANSTNTAPTRSHDALLVKHTSARLEKKSGKSQRGREWFEKKILKGPCDSHRTKDFLCYIKINGVSKIDTEAILLSGGITFLEI